MGFALLALFNNTINMGKTITVIMLTSVASTEAYQAGGEYELSEDQALDFIRAGYAVEKNSAGNPAKTAENKTSKQAQQAEKR